LTLETPAIIFYEGRFEVAKMLQLQREQVQWLTALTALNLEPSIATLEALSKSSSRHSMTKVRQTLQIALTFRKSAKVWKVGASCPGQPDQFDVALALPQSSEPL
jgi:hypothetical protein